MRAHTSSKLGCELSSKPGFELYLDVNGLRTELATQFATELRTLNTSLMPKNPFTPVSNSICNRVENSPFVRIEFEVWLETRFVENCSEAIRNSVLEHSSLEFHGAKKIFDGFT